jgi:hypothetical protein
MALEQVPAGTVLVHLAADVRATADACLAKVPMDTRVPELAAGGTIAGVVYASTNTVYPLGERLTAFTRPRSSLVRAYCACAAGPLV